MVCFSLLLIRPADREAVGRSPLQVWLSECPYYRSDGSARWLSGSLCKSLRGGSYSIDNVLIASTATDITRQGAANLLLAWVRVVLQQLIGGHQEARRTEATLEAMLLPESLLERMHLPVASQAFHRHHLVTVGLHCKHQARAHALSIHQHGTGAAGTVFAAQIGSGQSQILAQHIR